MEIHTKSWLIDKLYKEQRLKSTKLNIPFAWYKKDDFEQWCYTNPDFYKVYGLMYDFDFNYCASIERIDDSKRFTIDNVKITMGNIPTLKK